MDVMPEYGWGVVYAAIGDRFLIEAQKSADSVKKHAPNAATCLVSNRQYGVFDLTVKIKGSDVVATPRSKITALCKAPLKFGLYLDTDTRVCSLLDWVVDILNHYDVAVTLAPCRTKDGDGVPDWFHVRSGGVILMRRNTATIAFANSWMMLYDEMGVWGNQRSLRVALWEAVTNGLKLLDLPREYECKLPSVQLLRGSVKIVHSGHVHGVECDIDNACTSVNALTGNVARIYVPGVGLCIIREGVLVRA